MEIIETKLITLRASEDKILTNGEIYRRIVTFNSLVDSPNNWNEVPIEEYNKIEEEEKLSQELGFIEE